MLDAWLTLDNPIHPKGGVDIRALCRPLKFLHAKLLKPCLYVPLFEHTGTVMLEQE